VRLILHPDPRTLEAELLRGIAEAKAADPVAPVLVIVPTIRLARHVERRLAQRLGAVAAVEVLPYRTTARRILRAAGVSLPEPADARLLEGLLDRAVRRLRRNPISAFVAKRPAALGSLLGTLRELREAGVGPEALEAAGARALAEVHAAYTSALSERRSAGLLDEPAWIAEAARVAASHAPRWSAIFHHGAYEVVGMHLDLLRSIDRGSEVTWLAPVAAGSRATGYAEGFFRRHFPECLPSARIPEAAGDSPLGPRLASLHDEGAMFSPLPGAEAFFEAATAQGPEPEVEHALRGALARIASGVQPHEIAIVARSLEPYAAAFESVVAHDGLPVWAQIAGPLRREPAPRDFLLLLRAVADDFPRAITCEVLRSPHLRFPAGASETLGRAEALSRQAGIVLGLEAWEEALPEAGAVLRDLRDRFDPSIPRSFAGHEELFTAAMESLLRDAPDALRDAVRTLGDFERLLGDAGPVAFETAVGRLERLVDRTSLDAIEPVPGGIAVLDAMQARGLTFDDVHLLGLNAGVFPRGPREDPFLGDEAREEIRRATGRPLAVKREAEAEERQILASVLGSCRSRLAASWQRADVSGRARASSLALREIARLVRGVPDLAGLRESAAAVPSHPRERILHLASTTGLLRPDEAVLVTALSGRADEATAVRVRTLDPALADGLEMLLETESFGGRLGRYDGRVGRPFRPARGFAATALERLGACPLQFFFRDVLRVRELDEEADPYEAEAREVGARVHDLLREVYAALNAEGHLGRKEAGARAVELLDAAWERHMLLPRARVAAAFPVLHRLESRRWRKAIAAFLRDDLARQAETGVDGAEFETDRAKEIALPDGERLRVHGKFDRLLRTGGGPVIGEYKTAGDIARRGDVTAMLRGTTLQAPLYHLLSGGAAVEVLGVGPDHDPEEGAGDDERLARFEGFDSDALREGFLESLEVLASSPQRGVYPLLDDVACRWCAYVSACRKDHAPTASRHEREDSDLRDLRRKTKSKAPTLALVRGEGGA
jgi:RecB family exonuclease